MTTWKKTIKVIIRTQVPARISSKCRSIFLNTCIPTFYNFTFSFLTTETKISERKILSIALKMFIEFCLFCCCVNHIHDFHILRSTFLSKSRMNILCFFYPRPFLRVGESYTSCSKFLFNKTHTVVSMEA